MKIATIDIVLFISLVPEVLYRSIGPDEIPDYTTDCHTIPQNAKFLKLVMGSVIDYFKPVTGKTYCEMLSSYKLHQWSSNGSNWVSPRYYTRHLGGSALNYPRDGRKYLSFWGDKGRLTGGCCTTTYEYKSGWGKAFQLFYATGIDI